MPRPSLLIKNTFVTIAVAPRRRSRSCPHVPLSAVVEGWGPTPEPSPVGHVPFKCFAREAAPPVAAWEPVPGPPCADLAWADGPGPAGLGGPAQDLGAGSELGLLGMLEVPDVAAAGVPALPELPGASVLTSLPGAAGVPAGASRRACSADAVSAALASHSAVTRSLLGFDKAPPPPLLDLDTGCEPRTPPYRPSFEYAVTKDDSTPMTRRFQYSFEYSVPALVHGASASTVASEPGMPTEEHSGEDAAEPLGLAVGTAAGAEDPGLCAPRRADAAEPELFYDDTVLDPRPFEFAPGTLWSEDAPMLVQ